MKRLRDSNSVTIRMTGGLGNQLFQYSAALFVAEKNEAGITLDLKRVGAGGTYRKPEILKYRIIYSSLHGRPSRIANFKVNHLLKRVSIAISRRIFKLFPNLMVGNHYQPKSDYFDPTLEELKSPVVLEGYFQTHIYADKVKEKLISLLQLRETSEWFDSLMISLMDEQPIAIHIRRGDFTSLSSTVGLLDSDYYLRAIEALPSRLKTRPLWVFTDDLGEARRLLSNSTSKIRFIDDSSSYSPAESMILMSRCSANIIANSTFSWWAAYINTASEAVIAPAKWFKSMNTPDKLYPKEWVKVASSWEN